MRSSPNDLLNEYIKKRNFSLTSEPKAVLNSQDSGDYMIHLHDARRKHYDVRLQWKGVLKCWAVPKGPSLNPEDKRLAVLTEDHPDEYKSFEGVIPKNSYGAGPSLIWDSGEFIPLEDFDEGFKKGHIRVLIDGVKLKGVWNFIRMKTDKSKDQWLLIKEDDEFASQQNIEDWPESVATGRTLSELIEDTDSHGNGKILRVKKKESTQDKMPLSLSPQLAVLEEKVPEGDWLYERKYDGYRLLVFIDGDNIVIKSRNNKDWTAKFPQLIDAFKKLGVQSAIFDGEVVHFNEKNQTDFSALQNYFQDKKASLNFMLFDVLYLGDQSLINLPLRTRRQILERMMEEVPKDSILRLSETIGYSKNILQHACVKNWEGIIAKKVDAPYYNFRHRSWIKVKCGKREEFIVIGVTHPKGSRPHFGSILIAEKTSRGLVYRGRVGTGFDQTALNHLELLFEAYKRNTPPDVENLETEDVKMWVEPHYYAEVDYSEKTRFGLLRHPVFYGIRKDKELENQVTLPLEEETDSIVHLTHPDKILFRNPEITKTDLWNYYLSIMSDFLAANANVPLTLVRCPQGSSRQCFFQKHFDRENTNIPTIEIAEKEKLGTYSYITSPDDVKALVQLGTLEFHLWNCNIFDIERPLYVVFDLDPSPELHFDSVIDAAKLVREKLIKYKKKSYVRTTGGKGLHVLTTVIGMSWDEAYQFSRALADEIVEQYPDHFIATASKQKRKGKIFIDYLRNNRGATSVANFSTRAKSQPTVATPLSWKELKPGLDPQIFNIQTVPERLKKLRQDPWQEFYDETDI